MLLLNGILHRLYKKQSYVFKGNPYPESHAIEILAPQYNRFGDHKNIILEVYINESQIQHFESLLNKSILFKITTYKRPDGGTTYYSTPGFKPTIFEDSNLSI